MPDPAQPAKPPQGPPGPGEPRAGDEPLARDRQFAHLHLHTEYSLLDGANRVDRLVARVKELGMTAVAVTDHGNLFGAMTFYAQAKAAGVKPILGCEAYVAPGPRQDRTHTGVMDGGYHLVLLAENNTGWKNLLYLASEAYLTGFYYKPRMDRAILESHAGGLIAISGHLGSELAFHLVEYEKSKDETHYRRALDSARWHAATFGVNERGEPRFYVELQRHVPEQDAINPHLVRLARELNLPLVCDNDAHFLRAEDWDAHDTLCCISMGKTKADDTRLKYPPQLYVKSPGEMRALFADIPEALDNTVAIAERCTVDLESQSHAPAVRVRRPATPRPYTGETDLTAWFKAFCADYTLEPFDSGAANEADTERAKREADLALRELAEAGLVWRYGAGVLEPSPENDAIRARLARELAILADKHISAYFLIVWDFVNWGRQRAIPSTARGSGVGTMVGYCLGLSNACPVRYGLLFERFTDPDRAEYPDIDIDLCQDRRADVINYVRQKYGHVAQIITFGRLKAKAAIRDVGRAMGVPLADVDRIAKLVPDTLNITLEQAIEQEPELQKAASQSPDIQRLLDTARRLEGQARHASVHAAGVIVATRPLHEIVPLYKQSGSEDAVTQWDGPTCEKVGLLKMDFLGLRTLSVIERAKELIRETLPESAIRAAIGWPADRPGDPLDLDRLAFDDQRVFDVFRRADTAGVFQFESGGMRRLLAEMKPDRIGDLIAANALFRPGPMDLIPAYNKRKHALEEIPRVHEIVDRHTAETYGVMVYQEQVMQICHELGGIPLREAYTLIKAISKKQQKKIDAARPRFVEGAKAKGLPARKAEELFELILKFAGYGFNKSHSTGYAIIAYQTAWLKTYFPNQYMAAFLTYESGALKIEEWTKYLADCRTTPLPDGRVGVEVSAPHINLSRSDFSVVFDDAEPRDNCHGHVRFGLRALKGAGEKAIGAIIRERDKGGPFTGIHDFCERVPAGAASAVNKATIEALVCAGAFDSLHGVASRAALFAAIEPAIAAGQALARDRESGQSSLFGGAPAPGSAPAAAPRHTQALPSVPAWDESETLLREKAALGFYISSHPLDRWRETIVSLSSTDSQRFKDLAHDTPVTLGALLKSIRLIATRSGGKMAILTMEDFEGVFEAVLFPESYAELTAKLGARLAIDAILFVCGGVDKKRGEAQIIADDLVPVADAAARLASRVEITFDEEALNGSGHATLDRIAAILTGPTDAGSGSPASIDTSPAAPARPASGTQVVFVIKAAGKRFLLDAPARRVPPTPVVLGRLREAVGAGNVRMVPAPPRRRERPGRDQPWRRSNSSSDE